MPICPRCRDAYLDGESHQCAPRQTNLLWLLLFFAYIAVAVASHSLIAPLYPVLMLLSALASAIVSHAR
jgi:hypothetical protein